jgi:hypothetical protein
MTLPARQNLGKQKADGVPWVERLISRGKSQSPSCGFIFLLVVVWEASDALLKNAGYSILHWQGILFYLGVGFPIVFLCFLVGICFVDTPCIAQALFFYGISMGLWSISLWITRSVELMWMVAGLFFFFLALDLRTGAFSPRQKPQGYRI